MFLSPTFPAVGGGVGVGGSSSSYYRDLVWVDLHSAPGGGGNEGSPFNTANIGLGAVPDGGTIFGAGGTAATEPGVTIGSKSFTVIGVSGQKASGGQTFVLPTLTYGITTGTQRLAFRNVSVVLVHTGASASLSEFFFEYCPSITLTAGTDASPVYWTGDPTCIFYGAGGNGQFIGGTIAGYVANSGTITASNCNITGNLTSPTSIVLLNACSFGAVSITAPTITIDSASYKAAITAGVTFSTTPIRLAATAAPIDIGSSNTEGTSNKEARADHGHNLPFAPVQTALGAATGSVSFNSQKITNLAPPTSGNDAVNKTYADALASGLKVKTPAVVVATSNQATMSGTAQTIDGVALNTIGQRVLLIAQSTATQNGLWSVESGSWSRPADFAIGSSAAQSYVLITGGTLGAGSSYFDTNTVGTDVVDTNNLTWVLFSQSASVTAGAGLTKTGNTLDVIAADATIVVNADSLQVGVLVSGNYANNTIAPARITNAAAQYDFLMRVSSGSGAWEDGTAAQARTALSIFQVAGWQPVRAATTANITLSGTQTIDGVALIATNRCLVKNQTTGSENGIYVVSAGAWSRALDATSSSQFFGGMFVAVSEGTVNGNRVALLTTDDTITVGSTTLTFAMDRVVPVTSTAPADVTKSTAVIGTATDAARSDHKHDISTAAPVNIGSSNTEGTATSLARSDHVHNITAAVINALVSPGGATTQVQYNNAGVLDGASGIAVVSSETELAFGGTAATGGVINVPHARVVIAGLINAGGTTVDILRWGAANDTINIGTSTLVSAIIYGVATGGTHTFQVNGGAEFTFSATDLTMNGNNLIMGAGFASFSALPATTGSIRFSNSDSIYFRNAANSANLFLAGGAPDNATYFGDSASGAAYIRSGQGIGLRINGSGTDSCVFNSGVFDLRALVITQGTNPSGDGDFRTKNVYLWRARNYDNTGNVNVVGLTGDGSTFTDLSVGDAGTKGNNALYMGSKTFGQIVTNGTNAWGWDGSAITAQSITKINKANAGDTSGTGLEIQGPGSTSSNNSGGKLRLSGGRRAGTGNYGAVSVRLNNDDSTFYNMLEASHLDNARRILSLCRTSDLTTTEMPTNTGDLVIYIGNCATAPSANPVSGGVIYVESGKLKYRGSSSTVTTLADD